MKPERSSQQSTMVPGSGRATVPIPMIIAFGVLGFWGGMYLDNRAGGFHPQVYPTFASYKHLQDAQPKSDGDAAAAKGKKVYDTYCAVCHQANGLGVTGQFPPLAGSEWVNTPGPNRIIRLILNGIQGPIEVKGQAFNGAMPEWKGTLNDEDIAAVTTYIRQNKDWGNAGGAPVKPDQVKAIRDAEAGRNTAWGAAELMGTPDQ